MNSSETKGFRPPHDRPLRPPEPWGRLQPPGVPLRARGPRRRGHGVRARVPRRGPRGHGGVPAAVPPVLPPSRRRAVHHPQRRLRGLLPPPAAGVHRARGLLPRSGAVGADQRGVHLLPRRPVARVPPCHVPGPRLAAVRRRGRGGPGGSAAAPAAQEQPIQEPARPAPRPRGPITEPRICGDPLVGLLARPNEGVEGRLFLFWGGGGASCFTFSLLRPCKAPASPFIERFTTSGCALV